MKIEAGDIIGLDIFSGLVKVKEVKERFNNSGRISFTKDRDSKPYPSLVYYYKAYDSNGRLVEDDIVYTCDIEHCKKAELFINVQIAKHYAAIRNLKEILENI